MAESSLFYGSPLPSSVELDYRGIYFFLIGQITRYEQVPVKTGISCHLTSLCSIYFCLLRVHLPCLSFILQQKTVTQWQTGSQGHLTCCSRAVESKESGWDRWKMSTVTHTSKPVSKAFPSHPSQQDIFSTRWFRKRKLHLEVALRAQHQEFVLKRPEDECYNQQADW